MAIDGVPKDLACKTRDTYGITTFVETGTYKGHTTRWAAGEFERVFSIEAYTPMYERAVKVLADLPNVTLLNGDSAATLPAILAKLDRPALFWLDAHWCGGIGQSTGTGTGECPLREELNALNQTAINHFVMIDDARLFQSPPPRPHDAKQWPNIKEVIGMLKARHPRRVVIQNDVIIAFPIDAAAAVNEYYNVDPELNFVVLTSNDYINCVPGMSYLFAKHLPGQRARLVRYDTKPPKCANFDTFAIGPQKDYTWSSGLLRYLQYEINSLIILLLEDYFIARADVSAIRRAVRLMEQNPQVVKVDLSGDRLKFSHTECNFSEYIASAADAPFQTSLQAAIWRTDFLRQFLDPAESPWQFEKKGTKRIIAARKNGFDGIILGARTPALEYVNAIGGEGTKPGEFDRRKFPPALWAELAAKGLVR